MSTKDEYIRKMHSRLDQLNNEIDVLTAKVSHVEEKVRAEYRQQIDVLRSKRDDAQKRMNELQQTGESAWEDMKAGVELAWEAIGEALDSAKSRFK